MGAMSMVEAVRPDAFKAASGSPSIHDATSPPTHDGSDRCSDQELFDRICSAIKFNEDEVIIYFVQASTFEQRHAHLSGETVKTWELFLELVAVPSCLSRRREATKSVYILFPF
jgi:hypothetical protein